jgi:hypothetical protein
MEGLDDIQILEGQISTKTKLDSAVQTFQKTGSGRAVPEIQWSLSRQAG